MEVRASLTIATAAAGLLVGGCGSQANSSSRSTPTAAYDGTYSTVIPSGFAKANPREIQGAGPGMDYAALGTDQAVFASITITRTPRHATAFLKDATSQIASIRMAPGVNGGTSPTKTAVAGAPALDWQFNSAPPGQDPEMVRQVFVTHGGSTYVLMLTAPAAAFRKYSPSLDAVIRAWAWTP